MMELLIWRKYLRGPKVDNLHNIIVLRVQKDVFWLEVSVDDLLVVAVADRGEDLLDDLGGVHLTEMLLDYDLVKELSSRAQLSHQIDVVFVFKDFI